MQETEKPMAEIEQEFVEPTETNEERMASIEQALAHAKRSAEEGWCSEDSAVEAMWELDEILNTPQPLRTLERFYDICCEFEEITEAIAPRYFIILRALIFEAKMRAQ
jgi:hypothetical protein